jgi:hypothetical protein
MASEVSHSIEQVLGALVRLPLWAIGRASDLAWFQFGSQRAVKGWKGVEKTVGDYALHVQCPWRIIARDRIVIGRGDIFCPPQESDQPVPADFDWQKGNRFDRIVRDLLENESRTLMVQAVSSGDAGLIRITLEGDYKLEVFPHDSEVGEHWRFFKPCVQEPHWVFNDTGLQHG